MLEFRFSARNVLLFVLVALITVTVFGNAAVTGDMPGGGSTGVWGNPLAGISTSPGYPVDGMGLAQGSIPGYPVDGMGLATGNIPGYPVDGMGLASGNLPGYPVDGMGLAAGNIPSYPVDGVGLAQGNLPGYPGL